MHLTMKAGKELMDDLANWLVVWRAAVLAQLSLAKEALEDIAVKGHFGAWQKEHGFSKEEEALQSHLFFPPCGSLFL